MSRRSDEELIQALLDGELDRRGFEALERRMLTAPDLRALYHRYNRLGMVLGEKFGVAGAVRPRRPRRLVRPLLALAACGIAAALVDLFLVQQSPATQVRFGPESHGRIIHRGGGAGGEALRPGSMIELDHGAARIELRGGVEAYFEGPGRVEFLGRNDFRLEEGRLLVRGGRARCRTRDLLVESDGEFGLIADGLRRQQLNVLEGSAALTVSDGSERNLRAGESARWERASLLTGVDRTPFARSFPKAVTVLEETFDTADAPLEGKMPDLGGSPWSVELGGPVIRSGLLDTSGNHRHAAFVALRGAELDELSHVLLMTLETENPETSRFHSEGWAGVSLYTGDEERIFVGDPNGPEQGWALHPAGYNARHACPLLEGKTTVTLRYDFRSGLAQLFAGTDTSGPALASEWIAPRLSFDRLRIANGSQRDAAVDAGMDAAAAGDAPGVEVRGDIALRRIKVTVLSSDKRGEPSP